MKNLKIRTKLFILVIFMLVGLILTGFISLLFMSTINASSTELAGNTLPSTIAIEEMNTDLSDIRIKEYKHVISTNAAEMEQVNAELDEAVVIFDEDYNSYVPLIINDTDRKMLEEVRTLWDKYLAVGDNMIQLSAQNKQQEAMVIMNGESRELFDELTAKCLELVQFNKENGEEASRQADIAYASAQKIMIIVLSLMVIIAVAGAFYIISSITKPVKEIDNVARKIADGQLNESIHYSSKDELGVLAVNFNKTVTRLRDYVNYINEISKVLDQIADGDLAFQLTYDYAGEFAKVKSALEHISDSLNQTLGQINQAADQVSSGSDQVSSGAQALSQGATEQASAVEELAATINEISSQVNQNASDALEASKKATAVGDSILESNQQMQQLTQAMQEISDKSAQIGKIINTIEDIAFQTNILALNAAVEAARAGAAGKGFAVVADEVRNLASKSAEASKNTAALIEGSIHAVENGAKLADGTAAQLLEVVEGAKDIVVTIDGIADASKQQAASVEQVTQGVDQISSVVQTNSATAEESAAASEELSGQAQMLKSLVGRFRLKGDGTNSTAASTPGFSQQEPSFTPASYDGSKY